MVAHIMFQFQKSISVAEKKSLRARRADSTEEASSGAMAGGYHVRPPEVSAASGYLCWSGAKWSS
jgi:hypothetical protein